MSVRRPSSGSAGASVGGRRALAVSALILALILLFLAIVSWRAFTEASRERAAWKRVGTCKPVGSTASVTCVGVHLTTLKLPKAVAACGKSGVCEVLVNREAEKDYKAAIDEAVKRGLGEHITRFETVNRRRCRSASTGNWIAGCVSKHSHGIAVDFRPFGDNARWKSVVSAQPGVAEVVAVFRSHGFRWGGTFSNNYDPQHLEWIPR